MDNLEELRRLAEQRVAVLEAANADLREGLRAILEAWDKRATSKHSEQIIALIPAILQARSLLQSEAILQSSAASQGESDEPLDAVFEDRDRLQESEAHRG